MVKQRPCPSVLLPLDPGIEPVVIETSERVVHWNIAKHSHQKDAGQINQGRDDEHHQRRAFEHKKAVNCKDKAKCCLLRHQSDSEHQNCLAS